MGLQILLEIICKDCHAINLVFIALAASRLLRSPLNLHRRRQLVCKHITSGSETEKVQHKPENVCLSTAINTFQQLQLVLDKLQLLKQYCELSVLAVCIALFHFPTPLRVAGECSETCPCAPCQLWVLVAIC